MVVVEWWCVILDSMYSHNICRISTGDVYALAAPHFHKKALSGFGFLLSWVRTCQK